jgi:conjugal transfer pilus assembly protein TraB
MTSINAIVKRKQYLWLAVVTGALAAFVGGGWYLSEMDLSSNEQPGRAEPAPDMTGVVDSAFDNKVQQHATTEMQVAREEMSREVKEIRTELDVLNKGRLDDQKRLEQVSQENTVLKQQLQLLGQKPVVGSGEPQPNPPGGTAGPEGEPAPGALFPPAGNVPPPGAFYRGNSDTLPDRVEYAPIPVPGQLQRTTFVDEEAVKPPRYPYIPSGSFARAMLIEGADTNASVTGNEATVPMQLRITGRVEMPNGKTYDLTGCFVGLEAWGDVSSERAIVRTRNISCIRGKETIDLPIQGHVSFMGKNGIKGEVVMRNGKILGWAWGAGFIDGIGQGIEKASQPAVGIGATASLGAGDVLKSGIGGGSSKAAQTLSDYYIKRAEQYHPVIPIGAGNEITVVFQEGFQLKTIGEMAREKNHQTQADERSPVSSSQNPSSLNGTGSTDSLMKQLGKLNARSFGIGSGRTAGQGE